VITEAYGRESRRVLALLIRDDLSTVLPGSSRPDHSTLERAAISSRLPTAHPSRHPVTENNLEQEWNNAWLWLADTPPPPRHRRLS